MRVNLKKNCYSHFQGNLIKMTNEIFEDGEVKKELIKINRKIANEEFQGTSEVFGKRIIATPTLDECEVLAKKPQYARGKEQMLTTQDVSLQKFK